MCTYHDLSITPAHMINYKRISNRLDETFFSNEDRNITVIT